MPRTFLFRLFWGTFSILLVIGARVATVFAQFDSELPYEVVVEIPIVNNNFVQARNKALKIAFKSALKQDLREFLGNEKFNQNQKDIKKILRKADKYIKSYRFVEAFDDPINLVSRVKLEIVLFQDAVNNYLSQAGIVTGIGDNRQIFILIDENGLDSDSEHLFWEAKPISETSLTRNFIEEGIPVVRRDFVRHAIPEGTMMGAMEGDLSAAADIGMKVGADIVIVGNATATILPTNIDQQLQPVRVAISIKAIFSQNASLIAAKSDFATVVGNEVLTSELEAFRQAGKKLTGFLIPAIQKHRKVVNKKKEVRESVPAPEIDSLPLPWGDL